MDWIGLSIIIVLYIFILIVGVIASKYVISHSSSSSGQKSHEIDIVAGRQLNATVGIFTMTATTVGGGFINGTAESVYSNGILWTTAPLGILLGLMIGGLFYAGRMRKEKYITMFDPIQLKCGSISVCLLYLIHLMADLFWSGSILIALGSSLKIILDLNYVTAVCVSASVAILYTMFGQMISVAYTDIIQLVLIFVGLIISTPASMMNKAVSRPLSMKFLGKIETGDIPIWIDLLIAMTFGTIPWQAYFQRVLSMKNQNLVVILSFSAGFLSFALAIPPILIGIVDYTSLPEVDHNNWNDNSLILPIVIYYLTPRVISLLGLSAIAAAVMSSLDSSILSSSSLFTHNIYYKIFRMKQCSNKELSWVQRISTIIIGIAAVVLALSSNTIYGLFILAADIMFVVMFPQLSLTMFTNIPNSYGSVAAILVGLLLRIGSGEKSINLYPFLKFPFYSFKSGQKFPFRTFSMLSSTVVLIFVSIISRTVFKSYPNFDIFKKIEHEVETKHEQIIKNEEVVFLSSV